jgi:hypothetical protein
MPANVVKTKADEKHWDEAKGSAKKGGHKGDWAYIMGTYERIKNHMGGTKMKHKPMK